MSVKPIIPSIDSNKGTTNNLKVVHSAQNNLQPQSFASKSNVSFGGSPNMIVGLMDVIAAGGYAVSFILQDGVGFIIPRVGKGLLRGGEVKKDENGNEIIGKDGKPKRELNWQLARKEFLREIITGPSAFLIPLGLLGIIKKKFGKANNVRMDYIDGFQTPFAEYLKANVNNVVSGNLNKKDFYEKVFNDVIEKSINSELPKNEKITADEISRLSNEFAQKQIKIEEIMSDKTLNKKARNAKIAETGTVEDLFMKLKKSRIGGNVDETAIRISASNGKVKGGTISALLNAMNDYFDDAVKTTKKLVDNESNAEFIEKIVKQFTGKKLGSRLLTNLGLFGAVAAFYTQIPKLYNMGLKKNPALANVENNEIGGKEADKPSENSSKNPSFTGMSGFLEKAGNKVFSGKHAKKISDIFELSGPVITGTAMPVLLYGFCIPPRLIEAQDKYDYGEIGFRDLSAFTALLFGAKAIARLFSDGFTKVTGLALNKKNLEGRSFIQKIGDYLNPNDGRHFNLSSKQLESKYMNLQDYKGGVNGFIEFIDKSDGNIKKIFNYDKNIKEVVDKIVQKYTGKSFKESVSLEIKDALKKADAENSDLIKQFYDLFKKENGILNKAKTCNSTFGALSTIVLVPGFIMWLTNACERMTAKRTAKDLAEAKIEKEKEQIASARMKFVASQTPTMAGFLGK